MAGISTHTPTSAVVISDSGRNRVIEVKDGEVSHTVEVQARSVPRLQDVASMISILLLPRIPVV